MRSLKNKLFRNLTPGTALSYSVGSDCYGYWISEVNCKENYIGVYAPNATFTVGWTDGNMSPAEFDASHESEEYFTAFRGKWYRFDKSTGKRYPNR